MKKLFIASNLLLNMCVMLANPLHQKIIICGVGKNVARFLPTMMKKIEQLGSCFQDYRVIIYENNSADQSASLLQQWQRNNAKVMVICENISDQELLNRVEAKALRDKAPCRMELIAVARNKVLAQAMHEKYNDYAYLVMTDLDFIRGWDPQAVVEALKTQEPWDCLTANGISGGGTYYDRYAFRNEQFPLGPELISEDFWADVGGKPFAVHQNSPLKKVYSAFGGLAIFKRSVLKDCWYCGVVTADLTSLYERILHSEAIKNNHQYRKYQQYDVMSGNTLLIKYQRNSGYDLPVCCEHATLFASMIMRGHDKIYVHPNLLCFY